MSTDKNWISIFGVPVSLYRKSDVFLWCSKKIIARQKIRIVTANPEILLQAKHDEIFKKNIISADLITPDGAGTCWAATFFEHVEGEHSLIVIIKKFFITLWAALFSRNSKIKFPQRVSGSDLLWDIVKIAEETGTKIYLIGGKNGTAARAAQKIMERHKMVKIKAFLSDHIATPFSSYEMHNEINNYQPEIIFVAYGSPKQEEWIRQNTNRYSSVLLMMGVGGALDFIAGNTSRAPLRFQNHALEWSWRLVQRPTRFMRVLRSIIIFPVIILFSRIKSSYAK